jgi:hypothetical protein
MRMHFTIDHFLIAKDIRNGKQLFFHQSGCVELQGATFHAAKRRTTSKWRRRIEVQPANRPASAFLLVGAQPGTSAQGARDRENHQRTGLTPRQRARTAAIFIGRHIGIRITAMEFPRHAPWRGYKHGHAGIAPSQLLRAAEREA